MRSVPEPMPYWVSGGWDSSNYWSADDPENRVGDPTGASTDGGAGSGNFQFAAPIYSAPGRGINISLGLAYNSRVWSKANTQMSYDNDRGWPAPGFNLGFGKLLGIGVYVGCMIIDADGTRHSYTGNITIYNWGTNGVMHTTDGSFIDYTYTTGTNGVMLSAQAKLANGTVINYGAYSQPGGGLFPTFIEDANGNYITITYVNNQGPRIQTVTDTLGRVINFNYDYNNLLTAVTAPGLDSGTRELVRLHYHQLGLNYGFSYPAVQSTVVPNPTPWVVDGIYYPGTATGYWLNDSDSYSSYGMLAKVVEQRGMSFSGAPLTDMGTIYQGTVTRKEEYNYPLSPDYSLGDSPTYTTLTERWTPDGGSTLSSAVTSYDVHENDNPRTVTITLPNLTKSKQYSFKAPGQWNDGLVYEDRTFTTDENSPLQKSTSTWEPGAYSSPRPTRVEKFDERGQKTAAEFSYGSAYNQVTEVRDYDYGGLTLLRSTRTSYQNSTVYTGSCPTSGCYGRHIFNLPLSVEVYDGNNTRLSRTDYQYDGQPLTGAPNVVMHDQASNPNADAEGLCYWDYDWNDPDCTGACYDYGWCDGYCPQYYVCPYDSSTDYRGNVTQVTNYTDGLNATGAITETRNYDVTGNMVKASTACCEQTTSNYTTDYQYAYPQSTTRGSATDANAQVTQSTIYDFSTGLSRYATDTNGRQAQTVYSPTSLRVTSSILPTLSHTDYEYDDSQMKVTTTTFLSAGDGGGIAGKNVKLLNGRAQVRQEQALGANNVWDLMDTVYNQMGQVSQQTRPYRSGDTLQWTTTTYDELGRTKTVTDPDGSATQTFYNEPSRPDVASTLPGETKRVQDAWGRERWGRMDATGHLVEVVEPIFWGNGSSNAGMLTTYTYNILGNLITINSMSGTQVQQTRSFKYDSLGRLTAQKLAEKNATLNDAGTYVGAGTWSDVFTYDVRSNLISSTDARGVKTNFNYGNDPLNRLQSISWDTSGFGDTNNPILPAATVTYQYRNRATNNSCDPLDSSGRKDVTQMASVTTAGVSTQAICYDTEGRSSSKTLTLTSRPTFPFATDYNYDSLNRMYRVRYPSEYGNGSAPRKLVDHSFDIASRLSSLSFDGQVQASNIVYNPASQATSLSVGTGTNQVNESYGFNSQTGLLESQTITRNGSTLLNLSYDYAGANGKRTGQLTKIYNNLDHAKDRSFQYDALGRLVTATGGQSQNVTWAQRYEYDRYGNRSNVYSYVLEDYVKNFYQSALNRQPTSTELNSWLSTLRAAYLQGLQQYWDGMRSLGQTLFTSAEYIARSRSNDDFVEDLYRAFLYRASDPSGKAYWVSMVPINGRDNIRLAFEVAPEFYTKVFGTSPYAPAPGVTIPRDGLQGISYDTATNRISNTGWGYDAAGNQTRALIPGSSTNFQRYQYDAANRLVKVKNDSGTTIGVYTYGDSNNRLIAQDGDENSNYRTYYAGEGSWVTAEYLETPSSPTSPQWSKSYLYLGGRLLSKLAPNGSGGESFEYHHPDRLGTRIITNPVTGGSSEQVTLPFGTALGAESSGTPSKRRFTSYDRSDTTQLDYAVNRQYDSSQGRFTQVDPIGMNSVDPASPQTLNLFAYCANDPVNRTDSSGLGFFSFLGKLFNAVAKIFKIITVALLVAAVVVGTLIWLAPASSFIFKAALWTLFHVLLPAANILSKIGIATPISLRNFGSPPWNPGSRPVFGSAWQDPAPQPPDGPIDTVTTTIWGKGPWWDVGRWFTTGISTAVGLSNWAVRHALAIRRAICSLIPSGRVSGVSGTLGLVSGPTGGVELILNYDTGQISAFAFGGAQVGWNGAATGTLYQGNVYGLNGTNSNYSGPFTGGNVSGKVAGVFGAKSGPVYAVGGSASLSLLSGPFSFGANRTVYSSPLQLGRFWAFQDQDYYMFLGRQIACR
jgi:RHS repeat-associated protein